MAHSQIRVDSESKGDLSSAVLAAVLVPAWVLDASGRCIFANIPAEDWLEDLSLDEVNFATILVDHRGRPIASSENPILQVIEGHSSSAKGLVFLSSRFRRLIDIQASRVEVGERSVVVVTATPSRMVPSEPSLFDAMHQLANWLNDGFGYVDGKGKVAWANAPFSRIVGDLVLDSTTDIFAAFARIATTVPGWVETGLQEGVYEIQRRRPFGDEQQLTLRLIALDRDDLDRGFLVFLTDSTDACQLERELHDRRERLDLIAKGIVDGVWDWDFRTDAVRFSSRYFEMLGYAAQECVGTSEVLLDLLHPDDVVRVKEELHWLFLGLSDRYESEFRLRHADGSHRSMQARGLVLRDAVGDPVRFVGSCTDSTEKLEAQQRLFASERALRDAQQLVGLGAIEADLRTDTIHLSETAARLLGCGERAMMISLADVLRHSDESGAVDIIREARQMLADGKDREYDWVVPQHDGSERILTIKSKVSEWHEGLPAKIASTCLDVTVQRQAAQALVQAQADAIEASRLKSQFLANVSHELRTPLNGIIGMVQLLQASPLAPDQRHHLDLVARSSVTLMQIISDILNMAEIDAGKLELSQAEFDAVSLVDEVCQLMGPSIHGRGLILYMLPPALKRIIVRADAHRLRQILIGLLGNAVKFTPAGHILVAVSVEGGRLAIDVADTGIGIPEDHLEKIFDPFTQVDGSETRRFGGTGLGLSIVRRLCETMHGSCTVESSPGQGSCFQLRLPVLLRIEEVDPSPIAYCAPSGGPELHKVCQAIGWVRRELPTESQVVIAEHRPPNCVPFVSIGVREPIGYQSDQSGLGSVITPEALRDAARQMDLKVNCRNDEGSGVKRRCLMLGRFGAIRHELLTLLDRYGFTITHYSNVREGLTADEPTPYSLVLFDACLLYEDAFEREEHHLLSQFCLHAAPGAGPFWIVSDSGGKLGLTQDHVVRFPDNSQNLVDISELETILNGSALQGRGEMFDQGLDRHYLSQVSEGDTTFEKQLVEAFLMVTPQLVDDLYEAVGESNLDRTYQISHTIKGSARSIGAVGVALLAEEIESIARAGGGPSLIDMVGRLRAALRRVEVDAADLLVA